MLKKALFCSFLGACWLASYFIFADAWAALDKSVFYYFNDRLVAGSLFLKVAAYTNMRWFDVVSFIAMGLLYYSYFRKQGNTGKRIMICLGICMLLAGIIIKQCGTLLPIAHPSPTRTFEGVNRLTQLTDIATKDAANDSFPGDHGMMLMIFAAFVWRYCGRRAFTAAAVFVVVFSMPRIMSGAHWVSDIYLGSLSIACITMSWLLLTPASDIFAAWLERFLPAWLFPPRGTGIFR